MQAKRHRGRYVGLGVAWLAGMLLAAPVWVTPAAGADTRVDVGGLVDIVGHGNGETMYLNYTNLNDSNFDNLRARIFVQGGSERTQAFLQLLLADVGAARLRFYGGYVVHRAFEDRDIYLEAGKIPVQMGIWASHTYSNENPLVGIPFAYYYKSTLPSQQMPLDLDDLVARRGRGQLGINYTDAGGIPRGNPYVTMPILYDNCWDYGAFVLGSATRYDYAFGATFGAPGAPLQGPDTNNNVSLQAKVGFSPVTPVQLHLSFARGAYLAEVVAPYLPVGTRVEDYAQTLWAGSLQWGWRHLTVNSELFFNHYETPLTTQGLSSRSYYLEAVYTFFPGWYTAGRYDTMRYSKVTSGARTVTWDENLERFEMGVGYQVSRELRAKAVAQLTDSGGGWDVHRMLPAVQLSFRF